MELEELHRAMEAILFASGERIDIQRFADVFELDPDEIEKAADALANTYAYERRGMRILKLEKGYQMVSAGDMAPYVTKALETRKPPKLSSSQLETLTIIAYYQPATKAMVEQIRGVERMKNLFKGNKSRSEVVATFLAILDLCKTNAVTLEDDVNGENPNVRLLEDTERKDTIASHSIKFRLRTIVLFKIL